MALDFTNLANEASTQTRFENSGGQPVASGKYKVQVTKVKDEKSFNGFGQIHVLVTVLAVESADEETGRVPEVGAEFTAKFNVEAKDDKAAKAVEGNVKQLFALAIWNGLKVESFDNRKLQRDFGAHYCAVVNDAILDAKDEGKIWTVNVDRQRGKEAQKGHYWNHFLSKDDGESSVPAGVPLESAGESPAEDDDDIA